MKIRNGFVSNSSSSSFLICGYGSEFRVDNPVIQKIVGELGYEILDKYYEGNQFYLPNANWSEGRELNLNDKYYISLDDYSGVYITYKPNLMTDNKTIGEIKSEIKNDLLQMGFTEDNINIKFIQYSFGEYNG